MLRFDTPEKDEIDRSGFLVSIINSKTSVLIGLGLTSFSP